MEISWLSLVPPILAITTATITKQLNPSLMLGIFVAALIATGGAFISACLLIFKYAYNYLTNRDTIYLYTFLICIPSLVDLFIKTGAARAFTIAITNKIKSKRGIEGAVIAASCALAIDDYLSILTVGSVMRTIIDHVNIARVKLAYYIHSLSGPMVIMVPISSWVATITAYLHQAGIDTESKSIIHAEPFYIYLKTIPFMFYSLLTLFTTIFIMATRISFGPMHEFETNNTATKTTEKSIAGHGSVFDLLIPLLVLLTSIVSGILFLGDCWIFGGTRSIVSALQNNTQIFFVLCCAGLITFGFASLQAIIKQSISLSDIPCMLYSGFALMRNTLIMVFLVSILSTFLKNDLGTGKYLAYLVSNGIATHFLPCMLFFISIAISVGTGSSWGTFGLILPIAVPMLATLFNLPSNCPASDVPLLYPVLGAIFSGALCGDHISPFSETTLMTSGCTQITSMEHVKTQLPYAAPVILGCTATYLLCGLMPTTNNAFGYLLPTSIGFLICTGLLLFLNMKKRH